MKKIMLTMAIAVIATAFTGCKSFYDDRVNISHPDIELTNHVGSKRNSNYFMEVNIDLKNNAGDLTRFEYKFEWFEEGVLIDNFQSKVWNKKSVRAGEAFSLNGVAPNKMATSFRLKINKEL